MAKPVIPEPVTRLIDNFARLPALGQRRPHALPIFCCARPDDVSVGVGGEHRRTQSQNAVVFGVLQHHRRRPLPICGDSSRDPSIIAVVEEPMTCCPGTHQQLRAAIMLHGVISPREGIGPDHSKFGTRPARAKQGEVRELIISTTPGMEGDATAM